MTDRDKDSIDSGENTEVGQGDGDSMTLRGEADAADNSETATREELMLTLQDAQAKADEHWNQLLRAKAEMANLQRRFERELEGAHKYGLEKFAKELLPVLDSLELGLQAAVGEAANLDKVREGLELTLKMFVGALERFGVQVIDPQGERFNPEYHQAMSMQPAPDLAPNTVLTVYQKGYLLNDRLIRPAMVVVASTTGSATAGSGNATIDELA